MSFFKRTDYSSFRFVELKYITGNLPEGKKKKKTEQTSHATNRSYRSRIRDLHTVSGFFVVIKEGVLGC